MSFAYFCILHPDLSAPENTLQSFADGRLMLINKPYKWTSFDVVGKLRNAFKPLKLKVGHAGTLDPLATGLLIVCTGKMTKQIDTFQAEEKEYTGVITLGATTPSYDLETEVDQTFDFSQITEEDIRNATKQFIGDIQQYPPAHSAIKQNGERLYEKARRGEDVELKSRAVVITEFEIIDINLPEITFRVVCSKGTYIRSLANDFGKALNSGAYLSRLRRTRSGNFRIEDAHEIMQLVTEVRAMKEGAQEYSGKTPHPNLEGLNVEGRTQKKPHPNPPREGGLQNIDSQVPNPLNVNSLLPVDGELQNFESVREYRETANLKNYELLKEFSRSNRTNSTEAEELLWQYLRKDSTGFRIRRQHIVDSYIADFICLQKGLIIEIDGGYHHATKENDKLRSEVLNNLGFEVLRFTNDEVSISPENIFNIIKNILQSMPDRQTDKALPSGEGLGWASTGEKYL